MRKLITALLFAAVTILPSFAQDSRIFQRREIVEMEDDAGTTTCEIIAMDNDSGSEYFLNVGHMGFGDKIVQVNLDPIFNLYIKLGDTLEEAVASMEQLKAQVKGKIGASVETTGYLNVAVPEERNAEKVTVATRKPLLSRYLEFSIEREGYLRVATINKSDINGLTFSLKAYKKIHPKEK